MDRADDYVWVAVRVADGGDGVTEYRGKMAVEMFRQITMNELPSGWFALESVIWEEDRQDVPQSTAGAAWGYGDTSYYRVENLARIILLADAFVQGLPRRE